MANVLIVAYLLIVLALIAVILLQRSEGGGLGMGSSNANGLISVRGSANLLTRTTAILAALFFASAIALTVLSSVDRGTSSILDRASQGSGEAAPTTVLDALQQLQQQSAGDLPVPSAPAAPAAPATTTTPSTTTEAPAAGSDLPVPTETAPATQTPAAPATTEQPAAPAN
jgi:preprotein translocase subunit SecG